jgi:hypothetical protein
MLAAGFGYLLVCGAFGEYQNLVPEAVPGVNGNHLK